MAVHESLFLDPARQGSAAPPVRENRRIAGDGRDRLAPGRDVTGGNGATATMRVHQLGGMAEIGDQAGKAGGKALMQYEGEGLGHEGREAQEIEAGEERRDLRF